MLCVAPSAGCIARLKQNAASRHVRWRNLPSLIPWFLGFVRAGTPERAEAASLALRDLHENCVGDFQDLFAAIGASDLIKPSGMLYAYESQGALAAHAVDWEMSRRRGVRLEELDAGSLHDMEPDLAPSFVAAMHMPDDGQVTSPLGIVETMAAEFLRLCGTLHKAEVRDIEMGAHGPARLICDGQNKRNIFDI